MAFGFNIKVLLLLFFISAILFKTAIANFTEEHLKTLNNCVVAIVSGNKDEIEETPFEEFRLKSSNTFSHGTGFYYSDTNKSPKVIVTNFHVIENSISDNQNAVFGCQKMRGFYTCNPLKLIMIDKKYDLSIFEGVENFCKENIIIENNFNEGANISIYGNKLGLGLSFLSGIVSGKSMYISSKEINNYHILDANASYGNSGGPVFLVNTNKIIGILKSIYSSTSDGKSGLTIAITGENIKNSLARMNDILEFEKNLDFKIEEDKGRIFITNGEKNFFETLEIEPHEEVQFIEKQSMKTKVQTIYKLYEFFEMPEKQQINIVVSSNKKLRSVKLIKRKD